MSQDDQPAAIGAWPMWSLFQSSRHALQPNRLAFAAAGLLLCWLYGSVLDVVWLTSSSGIPADSLTRCPLVVTPPDTLDDDDGDTAPQAAPAEAGADAESAADPADGDAVAQLGPFAALRQHVGHCVSQGLKAGRKLSFGGHMGQIHRDLHRRGGARLAPTVGEGYGVVAMVIALLSGVLWLGLHHPVFTAVLLLGCLAVWAVCGGAICRIATVRFARDERLTVGEAFAFSWRKKWELILAPCLPVGFALICAIGLWIAAWICSWSFISGLTGLLGGLFFGVALVAGLGLAGAIVSLLGSFHLMWPTIAAEGSDFADAVGRGIMYTFQAVERAVLYLVVVVVYGSLAWMVVRGFGFLTLWVIHGVVESAYPNLAAFWTAPTFDALWATPATAHDIAGPISGAFVPFAVQVWVGLFVLLVTAYLPSFYFTASTIVYHVLRLHIDETDLDDIYLDDGQDDLPAAPPDAAAS